MNILFIITALGKGGAENLLLSICSELVKRNHKITVIYLLDKKYFEPFLNEIGVKTIFISSEKLNFFSAIMQIRKVIKDTKPDVVSTHLPMADFLGRIASLTVKKTKVYSTIHGMDEWKKKRSPKSIFLKAFNFITVNFFSRVRLIAVSESVKKYCVKHERISEKKFCVLNNFADIDNDKKTIPDFVAPFDKNKYFVMLSIARLEYEKDPETIFRAVDILVNEKGYKNVRLLVLGEGSYEEDLRNFTEEKKLTENIHFIGFKYNVFDYLSSSNLFVLASKSEARSLAALESFYCKTPVLLSDVDGNRGLSDDGKNVVLFEQGNHTDLANKIESFIKNEFDTEKMTENAYKYCIKYDKKTYMEELEYILSN